MMTPILFLTLFALAGEAPPNAFYAMDTCTKRPYPQNDIPPAAQLAMLKELGYAGIAWTEEPADEVRAVLKEAKASGLTIYAIYCGARVTPEGRLETSPELEAIFDALRGAPTVIWLHLGGSGPKIATLGADAAIVRDLRALAGKAADRGLTIAIYPHVGEWTERLGDAVTVARLVDRKNFGVTFNLCHTLATGDEGRIPALLEEAAPYLRAVTLNGADAGVNRPDWGRLIQPLDRGTYEVAVVLRKLRDLGYRGPIGLQGYGVDGDRRDNLKRSMDAWRRISAQSE